MKVGRNDPCPCGSGKKYKKCCLGKDLATRDRQIKREDERLAAGSSLPPAAPPPNPPPKYPAIPSTTESPRLLRAA